MVPNVDCLGKMFCAVVLVFLATWPPSECAPTIQTVEISQQEQCDFIMAAFEDFEARVIESEGDEYSMHLMDRLVENLGLRVGTRKRKHSIRHYLCQYVGVNSLSRLAAVHGMSEHMMQNYYRLLRNYWFFMRSELEETLQMSTTMTDAGRGSLRAYLALLRNIENTGFLEIQAS